MKRKILVFFAAAALFMTMLSVAAFAETLCAEDDWHYPTAEFEPTWTGRGTADDPYLIGTAQQLADLAYITNNDSISMETYFEKTLGKYFKLANDIDLNPGFTATETGMTGEGTPKEWTPIGFEKLNGLDKSAGEDEYILGMKFFCGTFDGNGHTIKGLYIKDTANEYDGVGLFGCVCDLMAMAGATDTITAGVKNLKIENCYINVPAAPEDANYCEEVGTVVASGTAINVTNCNVSDAYIIIDGSEKMYGVGGVVGALHTYDCYIIENISDCTFGGKIVAATNGQSKDIGGIVGYNAGFTCITNCINYGDIDTDCENVAGIVGYFDDNSDSREDGAEAVAAMKIADCINYGDITGSEDVGGIAGNTGSVWEKDNGDEEYKVYSYGVIQNCKNLGDLTLINNTVGGIVGYMEMPVKDCYNYGAVITNDDSLYIGGIVGNRTQANIENSYFLQSETLNAGLGVCGFIRYGLEAEPTINSGAYVYNTKFTYEGAQIRTEGKQGLRFLFSVSEEYYNTLPKPTSSSATEGFGTVAITEKLLDKCMIFKTTTDAAVVPAIKLYAQENGKVYFTVCVTDIAESDYKTKIVVAPYTTTGETTAYGAPTDGYSVYDVAKKIYDDESTDATLKEYLKENILDNA